MASVANISIKPVRKETITEKIVSQIRNLIQIGELAPGSRLPSERDMAKMLCVGRPSLREALKGLSMLGILEHRQGEGTFVISADDERAFEPINIYLSLQRGTLPDILEAREYLDIAAVGLAAERHTAENLSEMAQALAAMGDTLDDREAFFHHDLAFHQAYCKATGNKIIENLLLKIYRLYTEIRDLLYSHSKKLRSDLLYDFDHHSGLYQLIKARDVNGSRASMAEYLKVMTQRHLANK